MMRNGNLLVEVDAAEASLIRELLANYAAKVRDGEINTGIAETPADEARRVEALADRFYRS